MGCSLGKKAMGTGSLSRDAQWEELPFPSVVALSPKWLFSVVPVFVIHAELVSVAWAVPACPPHMPTHSPITG